MADTTDHAPPSEQRVRDALQQVKDPEIPMVSIIELGMIGDITIEDDRVSIDLLPTFAACPAVEFIRQAAKRAIEELGYPTATVRIVYDPPWTTDRITPDGAAKLKEFGLAPPRRTGCRPVDWSDLRDVPCPYCDSTNTKLESPFGPTLCRAIHYCNDCLQSFEQFKPVS